MENNVDFWVYASSEGENLYAGNCFEECLLINLEEAKKYGLKNEMSILDNFIIEKNSFMHKQDVLNEIFQDELFMDYDFALKLKRLDIISGNVFRYKTDIGKSIKLLIEYCEMRFVLEKITWIKENHMIIDFEVTHADFELKCLFNVQHGKYIL